VQRIESRIGFRSLRQLAREAGIPYSTLHQQICERRISLTVLIALAGYWGISVSELLPPAKDSLGGPG
jgi:lambda repressor-like predicted transcriptional regulator